jgi:hypothetical protein
VSGFLEFTRLSLRLHFRNRLALLYGYLFPLVFLVVFAVLYRHEPVPLLRHMGELLTVTVLGGACLGWPTTMVAERERGVWRRYRVAPVSSLTLLAAAALARFVILVSAGLLQVAVALAIGLTFPGHVVDLFVAFTVVALAFLGLGLVMTMVVDSVAGVQALGQCIFLPMLVIGGVAVPLAALPPWAQQVSAYLPGRYAVEALQAAVMGVGLGPVVASLAALVGFGMLAGLVGIRFFQWEQRSFRRRSWRPAWILPALALWLLLGGWAGSGDPAGEAIEALREGRPPAGSGPPRWAEMTSADVARLDFRLPPDSGVVTPIDLPSKAQGDVRAQVERVQQALLTWPPGRRGDDVQRVRHLLCIAAIPDVLQLPVERYLALVVFDHLVQMYPGEDLVKILTYIALHPDEGTVVRQLDEFGLPGRVQEGRMIRERVTIYATKFVDRLGGRPHPR